MVVKDASSTSLKKVLYGQLFATQVCRRKNVSLRPGILWLTIVEQTIGINILHLPQTDHYFRMQKLSCFQPLYSVRMLQA